MNSLLIFYGVLPALLVSLFLLDQKRKPATAIRNASADTLAATAILIRASLLDLLASDSV